jgi:hypothetical protein
VLLKIRIARRQFQCDKDFITGMDFGRQVVEFRTETQLSASASRGAHDATGHARRIAEPKGNVNFLPWDEIRNDSLGLVETPDIARRSRPPVGPSAEESKSEEEQYAPSAKADTCYHGILRSFRRLAKGRRPPGYGGV